MSRRSQEPQRFDRYGFLAIDPRAFFELFFEPTTRGNMRVGDVDVIEVSGPLVQRDEMWCDSYEAIRARVREACASDSRAIVMRFDSPGGDASGCFETARAIREDVTKAGKPLIAYVDKACSAAYALASAASAILIGETCCAGSVGVLSSRPDQTAANMQRGLRMAFVVSGTRKLDGNPDHPITEAELAETQRHVDDLAQKFFALVNEQRPQLSAASVAAFDGAVFYGTGAVGAGLADGVATFDEALAYASSGDPMLFAKSDYEGARAMLEKVAKGKDANAAAARRALATMAESAPPGDDDDKEPEAPASEGDEDKEPASEGDDKEPDAEVAPAAPAAESDDEPPADDKKKSAVPAAAPAARSSTELELAARVHRLEAKAANEAAAAERRALIAKRPDFGPELRAALAKAPLATVREMVKTLPKGAVPKREPITTVGASRGVSQVDSIGGGVPTRLSGADAKELDRAMGFTTPKLGSRREGSTMYFGHVRDEADDAAPQQNGGRS